MDRGVVMQNRICFYRRQYYDDQYHHQALNQMQGRVTDDEPMTQRLAFLKDKPHVYNKYDYYKFSEVDRENAHLATKIIQISHKPQNTKFIEYPNHYADKRNNFFVQSQKSLHKCQRHKEQVRIAVDNQKLLQRIKRKKSAYDVKQWEKEREKEENYIKNICLYQPKTMIGKSINKPLWTQSQQTLNQFKSKQSQTDLYTFSKNMDNQKKANSKVQRLPNQIILYKKGQSFNKHMFIVKIYLSRGKFCINLNCTKTPKKYHCEITELQGLDMLKNQYDNDIENFVSLLNFNEEMETFELTGQDFKFEKQEELPPQPQIQQRSVKSQQRSNYDEKYSHQKISLKSNENSVKEKSRNTQEQKSQQDSAKYQQSEFEKEKNLKSGQDSSKYQQSEFEKEKNFKSGQDSSKYQQSELEKEKNLKSGQDSSKYQQSEFEKEKNFKSGQDSSKYQQSEFEKEKNFKTENDKSKMASIQDQSKYQYSEQGKNIVSQQDSQRQTIKTEQEKLKSIKSYSSKQQKSEQGKQVNQQSDDDQIEDEVDQKFNNYTNESQKI